MVGEKRIMKKNILEIVKTIPDAEGKFNILREYLQCIVLKFIEEKRYNKNIAFVGGTALRFLYDLGRFSEDLDFSMTDQNGFIFDSFRNDLVRTFDFWNIDIEMRSKSVKTVKNLLLKFPGIMFETGVSPRKGQKLLIKLELDCNPPKGYHTMTSFNNKYLPMNILHYDTPSLFAGKLHAVLQRQYTKGRDFYDLMWFLNKKVQPNLTQLENALRQTTDEIISLDMDSLKGKLLEIISKTDFQKVQDELIRFLADKDEAKYVTADTLGQLIKVWHNTATM